MTLITPFYAIRTNFRISIMMLTVRQNCLKWRCFDIDFTFVFNHLMVSSSESIVMHNILCAVQVGINQWISDHSNSHLYLFLLHMVSTLVLLFSFAQLHKIIWLPQLYQSVNTFIYNKKKKLNPITIIRAIIKSIRKFFLLYLIKIR